MTWHLPSAGSARIGWPRRISANASALLDALSGIGSIQVWSNGFWRRYSRNAAGSRDFTINPGTVLWLEE